MGAETLRAHTKQFEIKSHVMSQTELSHSRGIASARGNTDGHVSTLALTFHRAALWLQSPRPYLMFIGFALFLGFWYLAVEVWKLPRFAEMPGPTTVPSERHGKNPSTTQ